MRDIQIIEGDIERNKHLRERHTQIREVSTPRKIEETHTQIREVDIERNKHLRETHK